MQRRLGLVVCFLAVACDPEEGDTATTAGGTASADGGTASTEGGTASADDGTVSADDGTTSTTDGGTPPTTDGGTMGSDGSGGAMVDGCLDFRDPTSCSAPECEWREGFQIEFDQGACGCAQNDRGLCVTAGSYETGDGREAYVFDGAPETVVVLDGALDPVPEGVSICVASGGEYCACAVGEANYCDL